MALSRIWSAFILTAILVALFKWIFAADKDIFSRMVVGRADDPYDSVSYVMTGSPEKYGFSSREAFSKFITGYGYSLKDSVTSNTVIITDNVQGDSVSKIKSLYPGIKVFNYRSIQPHLTRKADGIIETCKTSVNLAINLIGIMALFMGFMSIAERAGGIQLVS